MKPTLKLEINTHRKPALFSAVMAVLEPIYAKSSSETFDYVRTTGPSQYPYIYTDNGWLGHGGGPNQGNGKEIKIDAATEFGKLVELLEAPPEVRIKLTNHYAVIKDDKSGVQIGCQFAPKDIVRKVRDALVGQKNGRPDALFVATGGNETLARIVIDLAKKAGYETSNPERFLNATAFRFQGHDSGHLSFDVQYSHEAWGDGPRIDARTEMGKLIELLEGKKEQKIDVLLSGDTSYGMKGRSHQATITETGVTILGETITRAQVEEIWAALQ